MFNKYEYDKQYDKDNYTHMNLTLPKEYRERIAEAAQKTGLSKNAFVKSAVDRRLEELGLK